MGEKFVAWLSDLSKADLNLAGGKGANLGEMFNSGFPVPQAFAVTTDAFFFFLKQAKLEQQIKDLLHKIDVDKTEDLQTKSKEIRDLISTAEMPKNLETEILEAYDHFNVDLNEIQNSPGALAILKSAREPVFVSVRSSATAEDLGDASFAGQQSSFINIKGNPELIQKVKECFASIFTARSIYYRKKKGFDELVGIAAIVQKMINSDKSGVMFSKNPVKNNDEVLIEAVFGQGEGIVSGTIKPDQYTLNRSFEILEEHIADKKLAIVRTAGGQTKTVTLTPEKSNERVLKTHELKQLTEFALKLEKHYDKPQDIEFAIESDTIYILQTRPITTLKEKSDSDEPQAELDGQVITQGMAASPGIASGVVKIIHEMSDLEKIKQGDILVTTMTNPDMVVSMQKASAILTSEGGVTAHAAIVSREMGIPAIVGAQNALEVLKDGDEITIDGYTGKVFQGRAENKSVEILPIVSTKTKIKVLVDLPQFAARAAKTEAYGVGLVRLEGLIATSGKHPLAYEAEGKLDDYKNMLKKGLGEIADTFIGKPIWVRSSDIRSDEYSNLEGAPKEIEKNPMLGDHGIRFSLKHPEIFKAELLAMKELADKGHKFGVMFPQIISVDEVKKAKAIFNELKINNVAFGVMIETPAAAILIKDICECGIDFASFGTNDLTQYTLAIDRGNEDVQDIYDEMNWAVLKQISRVIRECKKQGVESSICGQAGSKPEMVKFLIKQGIDSISVNADAAKEISELIQKLETDSQIEPINNKEDIKEELEEVKKSDEEVKKENMNPEPVEVIEESKKEDIFN
ncbi:phosphoenolpyruvate synthase [archaeon]|jgi:pyruvate, water dikinase|nr:phosphoenolpyruvate synthase [archaeon]MBT7128437.1 phosphoenolpyruvate synthase [archaeon]